MNVLMLAGHWTRHRLLAIGIVSGLALSGAFVYNASSAAFTGYTTNPGNTWTTGVVTLTDDDTGGTDPDAGTAMFTAAGLLPGATATKCIRVSYTGDAPTTGVRLYRSAHTDTNSLFQYITLSITEGTGTAEFDGTPDCTNFTADVAGTSVLFNSTMNNFTGKTAFGTGAVYNTGAPWAPSGAATKVYKFTYTLSASTPDSMQGKTANMAFRWEAQTA
jgi:hypothetical protein